MRRNDSAGGTGAWQRWLLAVALAWLALLQAPARADALDGTLEVRSAYVTVDNGTYQLSARVAFPLNDEIRRSLQDGVMLNFDIQMRVDKQRRYWTDSTVVDFTLHRELSWHAVRQHYVVRDAERGELGSHASLDQALAAIGAVDNWPVIVESQLQPDAAYQIGVRAILRRGTLSSAMRALMWWSDSWERASDWYSWSLPR
ncbi:MAG: hypothetical protein RLZZ200_2643 [Pseudomonadota bacterium]|jgi:hypothetical protein